jgi:diadenylate cyclase
MDWQFGIRDAVDIALVAVVIYFVLRLIRGTRTVQMLIGLAVVLLVYELSRVFGLLTAEWLFGQFFSVFIVILVILFQHDIRRGLLRVAVNPLGGGSGADTESVAVTMLVEASLALAHRSWGGLIVLERATGLKHLYDSGVEMDMPLRPDVVLTLFCPAAPMHDGAIIVRQHPKGWRIVAARVLLPLAQANAVGGEFGTRHRAAVGVSEESDALVIVISEETGDIRLVEDGRLGDPLDSAALRRELTGRLLPVAGETVSGLSGSTADTGGAEQQE